MKGNKKELKRLILKFILVYLAVCVIGTYIALVVLVKGNLDMEKEEHESMLVQVTGWNQELLDKKQESLRQVMPRAIGNSFLLTGEPRSIFYVPFHKNVQAYGVLLEEETGEIVYDTVDYATIIPRIGQNLKEGFEETDRGIVKDVLYCRISEMEAAFVKGLKNQNEIPDGEVGRVIQNCSSLTELFSHCNKDVTLYPVEIYVREDGKCLLGKILLFWNPEKKSPNWLEVAKGVTMDLTPENTEGYQLIKSDIEEMINGSLNYRDSFYLSFVVPNSEYGFPKEAFQEEAMQEFYRLGKVRNYGVLHKQGGILIPKKVDLTMSSEIKEVGGKAYIQYLCVRFERPLEGVVKHDWGWFLLSYGVLLISFLTVFPLVFARKKYLHETSVYRNMLVNVMAHDLKTPLTVAEGYAESLKENINTEKKEYYAEEIEKNIHYVNDIISQNLTLAHDAYEEKAIKRQTVNLVEICQESIARYQELAKERKVCFVVSGKAAVRGDGELLQRAFDNLILNAMKYSVPESEIMVKGGGHRICIKNQTDQRFESDLKRLWEPFVRGEESRSGEKGSGIGLFIVKKILKDHKWKGKLVYNEKEKTFECIITIPWGVIF